MRNDFSTMRKITACIFPAVSFVLFLGTSALAQEHPTEHPREHPTSKKAEITIDKLAEDIARYVKEDSKLKGGFFLVYDEVQEKPLALKLDNVHKERLATLGDGVYFACADFTATDGDTYDIDVFMKKDGDGLVATEVSVHKKNGEARHGWVEENGIWKKKKK